LISTPFTTPHISSSSLSLLGCPIINLVADSGRCDSILATFVLRISVICFHGFSSVTAPDIFFKPWLSVSVQIFAPSYGNILSLSEPLLHAFLIRALQTSGPPFSRGNGYVSLTYPNFQFVVIHYRLTCPKNENHKRPLPARTVPAVVVAMMPVLLPSPPVGDRGVGIITLTNDSLTYDHIPINSSQSYTESSMLNADPQTPDESLIAAGSASSCTESPTGRRRSFASPPSSSDILSVDQRENAPSPLRLTQSTPPNPIVEDSPETGEAVMSHPGYDSPILPIPTLTPSFEPIILGELQAPVSPTQNPEITTADLTVILQGDGFGDTLEIPLMALRTDQIPTPTSPSSIIYFLDTL
jgi:hypothetical protein